MKELDLTLTWGGEHTVQHRDILQNCTPETYVTLLTLVTPVDSILRKRKDIVTHATTWMALEDITLLCE